MTKAKEKEAVARILLRTIVNCKDWDVDADPGRLEFFDGVETLANARGKTLSNYEITETTSRTFDGLKPIQILFENKETRRPWLFFDFRKLVTIIDDSGTSPEWEENGLGLID